MAIHNLHYHWYFPKYVAYHIHRSLAAQNYTDDILRPHVKPHIDNHALADETAFMQGGATPHTARIRQEVLTGAAIDVLVWPAEKPHYSDVIMGAMASQITSLTTVYSSHLFRRRSKKTSKLSDTGLCEGNSLVPAQMASNAENFSNLKSSSWDISIIKNLWSVLSRRINGVNPLPKMQLRFL